jgi:opacity protein-like surface antigen
VDAFSQTTNNVSALMFDINGHYVVNLLDRFEFYGLAGFDVLYAWKKEIDETGGTAPFTETKREQENGLGLNVGAGTFLKIIKQFDLYAEAKYVIYGKNKLFFSSYNQFMVTAGVLINLHWMKKNDTPGL